MRNLHEQLAPSEGPFRAIVHSNNSFKDDVKNLRTLESIHLSILLTKTHPEPPHPVVGLEACPSPSDGQVTT